ncbi:hypothetical protein IAU60_001420 [Kwoniella sp. DSM 27419]
MSTFSGALSHKRKSDLTDIADALGISTAEAKVADLVKSIQSYLDENETTLAKDARFKGLYYKKRSSGTHPPESDSSDSPPLIGNVTASDVRNALTSTVKTGRKSLGKAADRLQSVAGAANIPLPDSPIAMSKIADTVEGAVDTVSQALVPTTKEHKQLVRRINTVSSSLVRYTKEGQHRVDGAVQVLRDVISTPQHMVISALAIEFISLMVSINQFYDHAYYFPPPPGDRGTIASLLNVAFFWMPEATFKLRLPELRSFSAVDMWSAVAWWFFATVLPPYALSTIVSFGHKTSSGHRSGAQTRSMTANAPGPKADPLAFALIRLALLLVPLTSAAPSSMVDALEISGNAQARALGAGLTAALVFADKVVGGQ